MEKTQYSLSEASRLTGKSKSKMSQLLNDGELSYTKQGNKKLIDASELARMFPEAFREDSTEERSEKRSVKPEENDSERLKDLEIKHLQAMLEAKNEALAGKDEHIADLNRQLTTVTALLQDKREDERKGSSEATPKRGIWPFRR